MGNQSSYPGSCKRSNVIGEKHKVKVHETRLLLHVEEKHRSQFRSFSFLVSRTELNAKCIPSGLYER